MDLYIKNGKIKLIESKIKTLEVIKDLFNQYNNKTVKLEILDLEKTKYLLPGVIDPHVHMRDPGLTHKEDLYTGSMACAKGGVTTFIDMPNNIPATINNKTLLEKKQIASLLSFVNYGFHFGVANDVINSNIPNDEIASTKLFMNISTGKMLIENSETLKNAFKNSKFISVHAEDSVVKKAIMYSTEYRKQLYLCHISSEKELEIIKEERAKKKIKIYVEVTPHHLFLSRESINDENRMLLYMKPKLKTLKDVEGLWKGINDGTIDTIGSDHAPHLLEEKYKNITYGVPGVETSLNLMLNALYQGKINMSKLIQLMSTNPSNIFKIKNRGKIKKGYYADFVVVDLNKKFVLRNENIISKCKWTPFDGYSGYGSIENTIINGKIIYSCDENEIIKNRGCEIEYEL